MSLRCIVCLSLTLSVLSVPSVSSAAQGGPALPPEWRPVPGQILTPWAAAVTPERALPEYPRPTMVRSRWHSLNGLWEFAEASADEAPPLGRALEERILVPFPVESSLSGVARHHERVWYRRTFEVPAAWAGERVLLHFGAVDWEATVWVNGRSIGTHRGGYDGFSLDITDALKAKGAQEIVVGVWDTMDAPGPNPRGKQIRVPEGIWFSPVTGIWQTVWLEPVPATRIEALRHTPDVGAGALRLTVRADGMRPGDRVEAEAIDGTRVVGRASGAPGAEIAIPVPDAKLWWPERPFLYRLKVRLVRDGRPLDEVSSYFGMRKIALGKDAKGITRILLNGEFVFQVGPLDQGYWPDGLYTAPTDEALRFDIEATKRLGYNMSRKHVKVEPERWYYWADKLGLLVWQDMPNAFNFTPEHRRQFETELEEMVRERGNHPSIVMWVVFNEGWGQYEDTPRLTRWVKEMDPSRLVNNASGWTDRNVGDVIDMHIYPGPDSPKPEEDRAAVLGEFGGIWCYVPGHSWHWPGRTYRAHRGFEELMRDYEAMLRKAYALKDGPGLSAVVYTEITDVEVEFAGLLTYDRRVWKADPERIARANRGAFSDPAPVEMRVPTADASPAAWRYTTMPPPDGWHLPGFDDAGWESGPGGFGVAGVPGAAARTPWTTGAIWLRRAFDWPAGQSGEPVLRMHHDEDVEVYLNGARVVWEPGFTRGYLDYPLPPEAAATLKPGRNVLAIHCRQTEGGQFIDAGLGVRPAPPAREVRQ